MPIYPLPSSTPTYPIDAAASCTSERIRTRAERTGRNPLSMATHPELTIVLTLAAAWLMTRAGLAKNALELKRRRFICPSCGKDRGCSCGTA
jgi:hypothetical protein